MLILSDKMRVGKDYEQMLRLYPNLLSTLLLFAVLLKPHISITV